MSTLFATRGAEPGDVALLGDATRGDLDAFATLYRRHQQRVYRFARAMTGSNEAAEDITQEVFVVLLTDAGRFDPARAAFTTYVYGIVRNMSRHRVRRERPGPSVEDVMRDGRDIALDDDPSKLVEGAEFAGAVRRALLSLPSRYRELIVLCDLHDLLLRGRRRRGEGVGAGRPLAAAQRPAAAAPAAGSGTRGPPGVR